LSKKELSNVAPASFPALLVMSVSSGLIIKEKGKEVRGCGFGTPGFETIFESFKFGQQAVENYNMALLFVSFLKTKTNKIVLESVFAEWKIDTNTIQKS